MPKRSADTDSCARRKFRFCDRCNTGGIPSSTYYNTHKPGFCCPTVIPTPSSTTAHSDHSDQQQHGVPPTYGPGADSPTATTPVAAGHPSAAPVSGARAGAAAALSEVDSLGAVGILDDIFYGSAQFEADAEGDRFCDAEDTPLFWDLDECYGSDDDASLDGGEASDSGSEFDSDEDEEDSDHSDDSGYSSDGNSDDGEVGAGCRKARRGSAAWWQEQKDKPIFEGAVLTVLQTAFVLLSLKGSAGMRSTLLDMLCRLMHSTILPAGNLFPPSVHILRKLVGCKSLRHYEHHTCINDCHTWDPLPEKDYQAHGDDTCPCCKEKRFRVGNGGRLRPRKVYWDFGLKNIISGRMFGNEEWRAARATERVYEPYSFFGAGEFRRLNELFALDPDRMLANLNNSSYELGMDTVQLFNFKQHGCTVLGVRCTDMPYRLKGKAMNTFVLVIIPGPNEPKHLEPYLRRTLAAFKELGPEGEGLLVEPLPDSTGTAPQSGVAGERCSSDSIGVTRPAGTGVGHEHGRGESS